MTVVSSVRAFALVLTGRKRIYRGWWMLAGSVAAMAVASGVSFWAFSLYIDPLESEFGWSRAKISFGFSLSLLAAGIFSVPIGRWVDNYGPRVVIISGAILTSATFLLLATMDSLWQWYVYLSLNSIFRTMLFMIPFQALLSHWFRRRHGLAVGILGAGFAIGGLVMVPVMSVVIDSLKWQGSFVFAGVVIAAIFLPLTMFLIRNTPEAVGQYIDGAPEPPSATSAHQANIGLTLGQAVRTPLFWAISLGITLFIFGMVGWMAHAVPYYESVGNSRATASILFSTAAGFSIISRLSFGAAADRIRRVETGALVLAAFLSAAIVTYLIDTGPIAIAFFLLFWSIGAGGGPLIEPLLLTRAFGLRHFGSILGLVLLIETIGQSISPIAAGAIYDSTGSYTWALVMFGAGFASSFLLFFIAARLPQPITQARFAATPVAEPAEAVR